MAYYNDQPIPAGQWADGPAAAAPVDARMAFIQRTYLHLTGAVFAFAGLCALLLYATPLPEIMLSWLGTSRLSWLVILGAFIGVGWMAESWARSDSSKPVQYLGLGVYIVAEAIIFLPMLYIAMKVAPNAIPLAAGTTVLLFGALTASVFLTKHDFSWTRGLLSVGMIAALIFIGISIFVPMSEGLWLFFTCAMIFLACGYILYYTSNILHHYRTDQHVAASLALFAAVALLFWYLLQLFMSRD
ncbi:MAG: Bax inhibitor-1 family protein [Planctomycetota bacterium]